MSHHVHEEKNIENNGIHTIPMQNNEDQKSFINSGRSNDYDWDEYKKRKEWERKLEFKYEEEHIDLYVIKQITENFNSNPKLLLEINDFKGYNLLCSNEISKNFIVKNKTLISINVLISAITTHSKRYDDQSLKNIYILQTQLLNEFLKKPYDVVKSIRIYLNSNYNLTQILFRFIEESKIIKEEEKASLFSIEYELAKYLNTSKDSRKSFEALVEWLAEYLILRLKNEKISLSGKNFLYDVIDQNLNFIFKKINQTSIEAYFEIGDPKLLELYEKAQKPKAA